MFLGIQSKRHHHATGYNISSPHSAYAGNIGIRTFQ